MPVPLRPARARQLHEHLQQPALHASMEKDIPVNGPVEGRLYHRLSSTSGPPVGVLSIFAIFFVRVGSALPTDNEPFSSKKLSTFVHLDTSTGLLVRPGVANALKASCHCVAMLNGCASHDSEP